MRCRNYRKNIDYQSVIFKSYNKEKHLYSTNRGKPRAEKHKIRWIRRSDEQSINYISFWMIYVALRNEVIILFLGPSERSSVLRIMAKRRSVLDDPHFDVHY